MQNLVFDSFVEIHVAQVFWWRLAQSNFVIVEDNPLSVLENMTNVMSNSWGGSHMRNESFQAVFAFTVATVLDLRASWWRRRSLGLLNIFHIEFVLVREDIVDCSLSVVVGRFQSFRGLWHRETHRDNHRQSLFVRSEICETNFSVSSEIYHRILISLPFLTCSCPGTTKGMCKSSSAICCISQLVAASRPEFFV